MVSRHSLGPVLISGFICPPGFQPLEPQADKWAASVNAMLSVEHAQCSPALRGGSLQEQGGFILLLQGLLNTHVNCKKVVYFSMVEIGTHSSLGESSALCFFLFPVGRMQPLYRKSLKPFMNGTP